jgi:hypothetical protein
MRKEGRRLEFKKTKYTPEDILKEVSYLSYEKYLTLKGIEFNFLHYT